MSLLRKIHRHQRSENPQTHETDDLESDHEFHRLIDRMGGIESAYIKQMSSLACGCFGPPGGRCSEPGCGRISCVRCHSHCGGSENQSPDGCGKSLCRWHAYHLPTPNGGTVPFCKRCYGKIMRSRRWQAVARVLLPSFVERSDDD